MTSSKPAVTVHREPGTNLWFLDNAHFENWYGGTTPYILLHGGVGCGKTTLLTAIEECCRARDTSPESGPRSTSIIPFYFSSTKNETCELNSFLRNMLVELCASIAIPHQLQSLYTKNNPGFISHPADNNIDLMEKIMGIISDRTSRYVYILIDGLDEVKRGPKRQEILSCFTELRSAGLCNVRMLSTSRPENDILGTLEHWNVLPIPSGQVRMDIELYIQREFEKQEQLQDLNEETQRQVIQRLAGPEQSM